MRGQTGHNTRPYARLPSRILGMDAWTTSQLNVALVSKLRGPLMCLAYFFDMLSMVVCTTRHSETSGRLVKLTFSSGISSHMKQADDLGSKSLTDDDKNGRNQDEDSC